LLPCAELTTQITVLQYYVKPEEKFLAAFLRWNMPLMAGGELTDQEAWNLEAYIRSKPRPKSPWSSSAPEELVKLKPTFVSALYNLAVVYVKKDRLPEAGDLLRKVVGLEPRNVFGQHALGMLYVRTGDKTGAMQQYYILKDLDPKLAADLLTLIPK
jgi:predicted Zn-dependent protease